MNCYEAIDVMGDALDGALAAHLLAGLEEHFQECAACRNYFDQLKLTRRALGNLPPPPGTSHSRDELIDKFKREFPKKH